MRIFLANWHAVDQAEIEHRLFPEIEFVVAGAGDLPTEAFDADGIINCSPTEPLAAAPSAFGRCRIAVRAGVGYDNMDLTAWGERGVPVCNVPDYGTTEVADHAIALMLSLVRGTATYTQRLAADPASGWNYAVAPLVIRLKGATFGVIGLGRIGLAAARRAKAFDMNVLFYDPYLPNGMDLAVGYDRVDSLAALMAASDVVSIHAPLTAETRGLVGRDVLAAAKPGVIIVNTARGPIVDLEALTEAIRSGQVGGAGLDVLPTEPLGADHDLIRAWRGKEDWIEGRLMLTPHAAFYSPSALEDQRRKAVEAILVYSHEGRLTNCVNTEFLKPAPLGAGLVS